MIVSAEEAAQMAGEAVADGLAFCAMPTSDGWNVWMGQVPGVTFKVERIVPRHEAEAPTLVHVAP